MNKLFFTLLLLPFYLFGSTDNFSDELTSSIDEKFPAASYTYSPPHPITQRNKLISFFTSTQYGYIPPEFLEGLFMENQKREGWMLQQNWGISLQTWLQLALGARMEYYYSRNNYYLDKSAIKHRTKNALALLTGIYVKPFKIISLFGLKLSPRIGVFEGYSWRNTSGKLEEYIGTEIDISFVLENQFPSIRSFSLEAGVKNQEILRSIPYVGLKISF